MNTKKSVIRLFLFSILLAILSAGIYAATRQNNLGSDFYVCWHAGRMLFFDHQSPYGEEAARLNQLSIYKRPAENGEDQLGFAYPIFVLIPILPLIFLPYPVAQAIWIAFLILSLSSALLAVRSSSHILLIPFTCFYYPFFFGIILGNFAIPLAAFFLLFLNFFRNEKVPSDNIQILLGIILAWSTAKPQLTWLFILVILFFSLRRGWHRTLASFLVSLPIMVVLSFLTRPDWFREWLGELSRYRVYNQALPNLARYLSPFLGNKVSLVIACILIAICICLVGILMFRSQKTKNSLNMLFLFTGFTAFVLHPTVHSYEQVSFLVPFFLVLFTQKKQLNTFIIWTIGLLIGWVGFTWSFSYAHVVVDALPFLAYSIWTFFYAIGEFFPRKPQARLEERQS